MVVGLKSHSTDIPSQPEEVLKMEENIDLRYAIRYNSYNDYDFSSDEDPNDDGFFLSAPEESGIPDPIPDFNVTSQHSNKNIRLITDHKYCKKYYSWMH